MTRRSMTTALMLAALGAAHAQQPPATPSSVTIFGVVDLTLTYGSGSNTNLYALGNSGLAGSRLGFRGAEDLGGGKRASFVLESGFSPDTGLTTPVFFNRQIYVAVGDKALGELSFGRQYTPTFLVHAGYDAFGPQGVAAQQVLLGSSQFLQPTAIRANNSINYVTPGGLGGVVVQAMVAAGEGAATGRYAGVRGGWARGGTALDAAVSEYTDPGIGDLRTFTIGGRHQIGALRLFALHDRSDSGRSIDTTGTQVSAAYAIGATTLKASIAQSERRTAAGAAAGTTRRLGVGAVHDLSRRTALYTSVAQVANSDGASTALNGSSTAINRSSWGLDVGLRHSF